jgi:hypothetical protein
VAHGGQHGGRTDLVQQFHPFTDCGVLDVEREQQLADEWIVSEPHTRTCAAFHCRARYSERVGIAIVHVGPGTCDPSR